jgi:hypothetical protein
MTQEELYLFKLAPSLVTEPGAGPTHIVWSNGAEAAVNGCFPHDRPDHFNGESRTPDLAGLANPRERESRSAGSLS